MDKEKRKNRFKFNPPEIPGELYRIKLEKKWRFLISILFISFWLFFLKYTLLNLLILGSAVLAVIYNIFFQHHTKSVYSNGQNIIVKYENRADITGNIQNYVLIIGFDHKTHRNHTYKAELYRRGEETSDIIEIKTGKNRLASPF